MHAEDPPVRATTSAPEPHSPEQQERHRQMRGLLLFAVAAIVFILWRAGWRTVFHAGWWRF